ncbi:glycosyltransferase family 2 protein [Patescibacteria group bacterium]|nr:glycosyltransferase family 2 protein [Patescibacteria group bacterium]
MNQLVIVPAYNEAEVIRKVLTGLKSQLRKLGEFEIVVVDDGSTDETYQEAKKANVTILRHPINRGLGGALGTGLYYAKQKRAKLVVTFDADGQHDPKDIAKVISPILKREADVVIGSRMMKGAKKIPWDRRVIIWGSNLVTRLLFGVSTTDSQSGFRAFSRKAIQNIRIKTQEMEVSSEIFSEVRRLDLRVAEAPISVIYTPYSRKKGQSNLNAAAVLARLLLRLAR